MKVSSTERNQILGFGSDDREIRRSNNSKTLVVDTTSNFHLLSKPFGFSAKRNSLKIFNDPPSLYLKQLDAYCSISISSRTRMTN